MLLKEDEIISSQAHSGQSDEVLTSSPWTSTTFEVTRQVSLWRSKAFNLLTTNGAHRTGLMRRRSRVWLTTRTTSSSRRCESVDCDANNHCRADNACSTGATRVYTFSHVLRRGDRDAAEAKADDSSTKDEDIIGPAVPAKFAHVDQSDEGALCVLNDHFSEDEVATLSKTRWGIINAWRPLKPIARDPLGICDARSIADDSLVPVDAELPKRDTGFQHLTHSRVMQTLAAKASDGQQWYYASNMVPGEALLIKCFDTKDDGKTARRAPHSAFVDPRTANIQEPRESVELRALVFWEDQEA